MNGIKAYIVQVVIVSLVIFSASTAIAQEFRSNAKVTADELNVRTEYPSLISDGLLKWKWELGNIIYVLKKGDEIEIIEQKIIANTRIWYRINYQDNARNINTGWIYGGTVGGESYIEKTLGQKSIITPKDYITVFNLPAFLSINQAFAQDVVEPVEESLPPPPNLQVSAIILALAIFILVFIVFKYFPIKSEYIKSFTAMFLVIITLIILGVISEDNLRLLFGNLKH